MLFKRMLSNQAPLKQGSWLQKFSRFIEKRFKNNLKALYIVLSLPQQLFLQFPCLLIFLVFHRRVLS